MAMQVAILLVALCGVYSFQIPAPRTTCQHRYQQQQSASRVFELDAEGVRSTTVGRSLLYGMNAGSSGGEEIKAASPDAGQQTSDSSGGREKPARVSLIKKYGSAGLVAYGLLNGVWYTGGITYVMLGPMGLVPAAGIEGTISASVKQLGKVVGLVWLGSQATKPVRYALAALLSPAADRLIDTTQRRLGLSKKADAVKILVVSIFGSTCVFCLAIIAVAVARAAVVSTAVAATASTTARPASSSSAALLLLGLRGKCGGVGHGLGFGGCGGGGGVCDRGAFPSLPWFVGARNRAAALDRECEAGAVSRPRRRVGNRIRRAARVLRRAATGPTDSQ